MSEPNIPHRKRTFWEIASDLLSHVLHAPSSWTPEGSANGSSPGSETKLPGASWNGRDNFIREYNRNAMNFVPGAVAHNIYRDRDSQRGCEAAAHNWLEAHEHFLTKARSRGYSE